MGISAVPQQIKISNVIDIAILMTLFCQMRSLHIRTIAKYSELPFMCSVAAFFHSELGSGPNTASATVNKTNMVATEDDATFRESRESSAGHRRSRTGSSKTATHLSLSPSPI